MEKLLRYIGIFCCVVVLSSFITSDDVIQRGLIIEGDSELVSNSFELFKKKNPQIKFDVFQFAHNSEDGSGNAIAINFYGLYQYDYILISVHEGSLSNQFIERLSAYVLDGGRAYVMYQSYPRPYYVESMAETSNQFLKYLHIDDEIIYDSLILKTKMYGSLLEVDDKTRKINTSRKAINSLKHTPNTTSSQYFCEIDSGHFFYKNSDLSDATTILEFNADSLRAPIAAFWTAGKGVLGIGTEKYSSCSTRKSSGSAWQLIWKAINKTVEYAPVQNQVFVDTKANAEVEFLTQKRLDQIRRQEEINLKNLKAELDAETERLQAEFKRYVASEKLKLKEYKFRNKIEQIKLKRELENIVYELKHGNYSNEDSNYDKNEIAYIEDEKINQIASPQSIKQSSANQNINGTEEPQAKEPGQESNQGSISKNKQTQVVEVDQSVYPGRTNSRKKSSPDVKVSSENLATEVATANVDIPSKQVQKQYETNTKSQQKAKPHTKSYKKNLAALNRNTTQVKLSKVDRPKVELTESMLSNNQILVSNPNDVFAQENRKKIDEQLSDIQAINNSTIVLIESHLDFYEKPMDNILKSIRSGNKIKKYYVRNGVDPNKIILYGMGSAYGMGNQMVISKRESDFIFKGNIKKLDNQIASSTAYDLYEKKSEGITFRISLGTKPIAWNPKLIEKLGDFSVEQYGNERIMTGVVGIFKDPYFVHEIIDIIQDWKMPNPELLVYLDGIRLNENEIVQLSSKHQELESYLKIIAKS